MWKRRLRSVRIAAYQQKKDRIDTESSETGTSAMWGIRTSFEKTVLVISMKETLMERTETKAEKEARESREHADRFRERMNRAKGIVVPRVVEEDGTVIEPAKIYIPGVPREQHDPEVKKEMEFQMRQRKEKEATPQPPKTPPRTPPRDRTIADRDRDAVNINTPRKQYETDDWMKREEGDKR